MIPPSPIAFNAAGIETRSHDDPKKTGYLVRLPARGNVWMAVEDAIRSGLVAAPPPLPSGTPSQPLDRAEVQARLNRLLHPNV